MKQGGAPSVAIRAIGVLGALASCAPKAHTPDASPSASLASAASVDAADSKSAAPSASAAPVALTALEQLRADARTLAPLATSELSRRFLAATAVLPDIPKRTLYRTADKKRFYTEAEARALPDADRAALVAVEVDEDLYYDTKYGSPLTYARPLDLLARAHLAGPDLLAVGCSGCADSIAVDEKNVFTLPGAGPPPKIFDFGYGYVGHLRLLAALGFDATGVDVDPLLRALYAEPGDQGPMPLLGGAAGGASGGSVRLLDGAFPADPAITRAVGVGYRAILSKNVLKKGYIHPDRPADDKFLIHLGVDDRTFLGALHDALLPRGYLLLYNICPALSPPDKPFVPWSDGRSPFSREEFRAARFRVVDFDQDDTPAIRAMGHALQWDKGDDAMDLEGDLSVLYTLVVRAD